MKRRKITAILLFMLPAAFPQAAPAAQQGSAFAQARAEADAGRFERAGEIYRQVLQAYPDDPKALGGLADALEAQGHWREAIPFLSRLVELEPKNSARLFQLAKMKSWHEETRLEAAQLFARALKSDPDNDEILASYAEMLSWSRSSRPQARAYFELALQKNPRNLRAIAGKAQLLAWNGEPNQALALYDQVLDLDPANVPALRGKAEIMNWKGRFLEASVLAQRARAAAPSDEQTTLELARAYVGLHKFAEAQQVIAGVDGGQNPDILDVRHEVQRGLGTYVESRYAFREEPTSATSSNVEFHRLDLAVSTPVGPGNRLTFLYQPTLYNNFQQGFNSNYFGAALDSSFSDRLSSHAYVGAQMFQNAPVNVEGAAGLSFKPISSTLLKFSFQRQPVEESLLSIRGQNSGGAFFGQVYSNLADVGISYDNAAHKMDFALDYTGGAYTGRNLDINRRFSVDAQIGKALHSDQPYVRFGYYADYTSFDHDAELQIGQPLSRQSGGYFSPTRYLLNQGVLTVSQRFGKNLSWGMSGTAGAQNVETLVSSFQTLQFASSFETHLLWRISPRNEARLGYEYLNVFNAFQRNLFRFSWRHYF
jgi:tetratricopeptide (TPR) repeat protein